MLRPLDEAAVTFATFTPLLTSTNSTVSALPFREDHPAACQENIAEALCGIRKKKKKAHLQEPHLGERILLTVTPDLAPTPRRPEPSNLSAVS